MKIQLTYKNEPILNIVSIIQVNDPVSGAPMLRFLSEDGKTSLYHFDEIRSISEEPCNCADFTKSLWALNG